MFPRTTAAWIVAGLLASLTACRAERPTLRHTGMAGASAAAALTTNLVVVANDEDNVLRVYRTDESGDPVQRIDISAHIDARGRFSEADIEGGARIGDRIYWLGSHSRNKDGKLRPNRHRLFATQVHTNAGQVTLRPIGGVCRTLADQLAAAPALSPFHLRDALSRGPEESGAFNLEGLAAAPEGALLIAFRNPVPDGKALLVPLRNPIAILEGAPAEFGPPVQLDLGGLGIRDIVWTGREWFVAAGGSHKGGRSRMFRWTGDGSPARVENSGVKRLNPEAIAVFGSGTDLSLLVCSDDGNKNATVPAFRSIWLIP
jgi:hypothetical protein